MVPPDSNLPAKHDASKSEDGQELDVRVVRAGGSEDIAILEAKIAKYLKIRDKIRQVIRGDVSEREAMVDDIVRAFTVFSSAPAWVNITSVGIVPLQNWRKRKKIRKIIETVLDKVFDATLDYVMDFSDLKRTCLAIGGKGSLGEEDYQAIYAAVLEKLESGPFRDRCLELGVLDFLDYKLFEIKKRYEDFKVKEL